MNKITCDICLDLIPLVKDDIASEESKLAVLNHIQTCEKCRAIYNGSEILTINTEQAFHKIKRQLQLGAAMLLMFGIFFGLSLTNSSELFYNSLIMPLIGALGYFIFQWRAVYEIPILLFMVHGVTNLFGMVQGKEYLDWYSLIIWTAIYAFFALLGVVIAFLLHFAFRKEDVKDEEK